MEESCRFRTIRNPHAYNCGRFGISTVKYTLPKFATLFDECCKFRVRVKPQNCLLRLRETILYGNHRMKKTLCQ